MSGKRSQKKSSPPTAKDVNGSTLKVGDRVHKVHEEEAGEIKLIHRDGVIDVQYDSTKIVWRGSSKLWAKEMIACDIETYEEPHECSMCGGPSGLIGILGTMKHYSCRNCGAQTSESL